MDETQAQVGEFSIDSVPEDIRGGKYWEQVNTHQDLYKQFDGLQKMIGGKTFVPSEGSSTEDWGKFYNKMGRPESSDGYNKEGEGNPEFMGGLRDVFHDAGLSSSQGNKISDAISAQFVKDASALTELTDSQSARATELSAALGEGADSKIEVAKKALLESEVGKMLGENEDIDPVSLAVLASALDGIMKKHVNSDGLADTTSQATPEGLDLNAKLSELMNHPARTQAMHPQHADVSSQIRQICIQLESRNL